MNFTHKLVERISIELSKKLEGYFLQEIFSSGKDELFFNFSNTNASFGIKLIWAARSCFIFTQETIYPKPTPHHLEFNQLNKQKVISIKQHQNNRSFQINLENKNVLVFKLYNGLSNVLHYKNEELVSHFRGSIESDLHLKLSDFDRHEITHKQSAKNVLEDADDFFESVNYYSRSHLALFAFDELKRTLLQQNKSEIKRCEQLLLKSNQALQNILLAIPLEEVGHIIMANLQLIEPKQTEVELLDFYRNKNIAIKLKKELNAQQNAEYYYRKSKKQKIELEQIQKRMDEATNKLEQLNYQFQKIEQAETLKDLKSLSSQKSEVKKQRQALFKEFECDGFKIWVGKSAANNDLLTMKHAHKNDLWLHAKGVSGSHVVIKHQPGKPFTKNAIEYAASLAAYYSKSKGSSLVPVVFVERKFVRKPKGANPGAVVIDKEEVIMVKPHI
jgi:predicted ribosome quality control (RQC) complex YloA/Tae2 family protein